MTAHEYPERDQELPGEYAVDVRSRELTGSGVPSRALAGDGLGDFLAALDADWRGWDGVRHWASTHEELEIDAAHDGRRVTFHLTVRRRVDSHNPGYAGGRGAALWELRLPVVVEPGEQLSRLAEQARGLGL